MHTREEAIKLPIIMYNTKQHQTFGPTQHCLANMLHELIIQGVPKRKLDNLGFEGRGQKIIKVDDWATRKTRFFDNLFLVDLINVGGKQNLIIFCIYYLFENFDGLNTFCH